MTTILETLVPGTDSTVSIRFVPASSTYPATYEVTRQAGPGFNHLSTCRTAEAEAREVFDFLLADAIERADRFDFYADPSPGPDRRTTTPDSPRRSGYLSTTRTAYLTTADRAELTDLIQRTARNARGPIDRDHLARRLAARVYGAASQYPTTERDRGTNRAVRELVDEVLG